MISISALRFALVFECAIFPSCNFPGTVLIMDGHNHPTGSTLFPLKILVFRAKMKLNNLFITRKPVMVAEWSSFSCQKFLHKLAAEDSDLNPTWDYDMDRSRLEIVSRYSNCRAPRDLISRYKLNQIYITNSNTPKLLPCHGP